MLLHFNNYKPKQQTFNVVLLNGGMGDIIGGGLIVCSYMIKQYPWVNLLVWIPDFLLEFTKKLLPSHICVRPFSAMEDKFNIKISTLSTEWDGRTSPMKIHQVDYSFLRICDEMPSIEHKNSLAFNTLEDIDITSFNLPDKYVCIAIGHTSRTREWKIESLNEVIGYVKLRGYTPVFLGNKTVQTGQKEPIQSFVKEGINLNEGINLLDKTTLLQTTKIISKSKCIIGMDGGLLHLAGCTNTAIVGGFTTVAPEIRMPIRNNQLGWNYFPVTPPKTLQCRFCQNTTNFLQNHDYRYCIYKNYACIDTLKPDTWVNELEKVFF